MKDQHKLITGYRDLSARQIEMINEIKAQGEQLDTLVHNLKHDLYNSGHGAGYQQEGQKWIVIGTENLQLGIMALVRSVAQPDSF